MKSTTLFLLHFFTLIFIPTICMQAQLMVDGDTIYVSKKTHPFMQFESEVQTAAPTGCDEGNYDLRIGEYSVHLVPGKDNPESPCSILISTGSRKRPQQFRFTVIYKDQGRYDDYIQLNSKEAIESFLSKNKNKSANQKTVQQTTIKEFEKTSPAKPVKKIDNETSQEATSGDDELEAAIKSIDKNELKSYIDKLIDAFNTSLGLIHKNRRNANANTLIKRVIEKVFNNNRDRIVQQIAGKLNSNIETYKITEYLDRFKLNSKYEKLDVTASNIEITGPIRAAPNGKYYATVVYLQTYTGYSTNELRKTYRDQVKKTAEIEIVINKDIVDGTIKYNWQAFLTDIKVNSIE